MGKEQLNLRIASSDLALLTEIANDMNLSVGTLGSKVITDFVQFYYYKIQRGDITLSKPILKKLFEAIDPSKTDEIAEYVSQYVFSEIKAQVGTVTYKILVEHFLKWNKGNHLLFNKLPQKDSDLFISKHNICKTWSEIQCKIYSKCFELAGQTVLEMDYDSDNSYSIEVVRHA